MKEYLKLGFLNPQNLFKATKMTRKQVVLYFLLLTLIITFSMTSVILNVMSGLREDGQEITENIPEFEIEDNQLTTETDQESFIHKTDSFLLFFDPNGTIETEEIDSNTARLNVPIGIGLMENALYLNLAGRGAAVPYEQIEGLNDTVFTEILSEIGRFSPLVLLFVFVFSYLASGFGLLYEWLLIALITNIMVTLSRLRIPFRKNARMALLSLSIPTLVISLVEAIGFIVPFAFELKLGFAVYFLYTSIQKLKPKKKDKK